MENGWRWMVAYYATLRLGGVVIPCNILLTADEVGFITGDSGAKAMIVAHDKAPPAVQRLSRRARDRTDSASAASTQPDLDSLLARPADDVGSTPSI